MMRILPMVLAIMALPVWADPAAVSAVNGLRAAKGRAAVVYDPVLERAAAAHAQDMARHDYFSHQGKNGSSVGQRISAQGYKWCFAAENIAKGQKSLAAVMQSWAGSQGHYQNIMHRKVRGFGLARAEGNVWVMVLAAPC
tara:strand:- start:7972 stop:8391 length:420 start_codon:yes stop_codon:yes gene_type:complete